MTDISANEIISAATILLLRDMPAFEVLMIERHVDISFAGGAMVFPGGKLDPADHEPAWAPYCDGCESIPDEQIAPRIAAIREAFEETGILLARRSGQKNFLDDAEVQSLGDWRQAVEEDGARFLQLVKQEGLILATGSLIYYARWAPPAEVRHRRFDTWFFAAEAPTGQQAREDGNEATEAIWTTPACALADRDSGARKMIFPTARNVELLNQSGTMADVFGFAARRKIETIQPNVIERNGRKYVTIPEDMGYPVTEEPIETAFRV